MYVNLFNIFYWHLSTYFPNVQNRNERVYLKMSSLSVGFLIDLLIKNIYILNLFKLYHVFKKLLSFCHKKERSLKYYLKY